LDRIDALVALVADRHGLALLPDGRLAAAEARVAVRATGLALPGGAGVRASTVTHGSGGAAPRRGRGCRAAAGPRRPAGGDEPVPTRPGQVVHSAGGCCPPSLSWLVDRGPSRRSGPCRVPTCHRIQQEPPRHSSPCRRTTAPAPSPQTQGRRVDEVGACRGGLYRAAKASLAPSETKQPAKTRRIQVITRGREVTWLLTKAAKMP
jgi:hypothetical protein